MIDSIETMSRIKDELGHNYDFYGYENNSEFENRINQIAEETKIREMIPVIGDTLYNDLVTLGYSGLTGTQINIFFGEVYFICSDFIFYLKNREAQEKKYETEKIVIEGYERTQEGRFILEDLETWYNNRAVAHMNIAGYLLG